MRHSIFKDHKIGAFRVLMPGEIEAEYAEFIDRAAMLLTHHNHGRITSATKMSEVLSIPVEPSGKPFGELTWPEMQVAYDHLVARAQDLNAPFQDPIEAG